MKYVMDNGIYIPANEFGAVRIPSLDDIREFVLKGMEMAGFVPDEGEKVAGDLVNRQSNADRGASLELGLFTNVAPGETITEATITEPTGTGYARISLVDANWTGAGDNQAYALQTFTAGAGGWAGSVQGYFIATTGTTPRILAIEVDASGPYTFAASDTYDVTPNMRYA